MSRIEQALRRAQQAGTPEPKSVEPSPAPPAADGLDDDARLASVWGFDHAPAQGRAPDAEAPPEREEPVSAEDTPPGVLTTTGAVVSEKLVGGVDNAPVSPMAAEQYRQLAASLHHAQKERNIGVVMVASAVASEGKTLTSTNLALTLSQSYRKRVLLIDADLRRPSIHEVFQLPNLFGLTDGLRSTTERRLPLVRVTERLSVLTAGRATSDPMSILTSERMHRLIEEAAEKFDWVIIDTPPVGLLSDANLLSAMVDTAILVLAAGSTPYELVQRAVDAIGRERIFGVVLNRADEQSIYGGYNYGSYYRSYSTRE